MKQLRIINIVFILCLSFCNIFINTDAEIYLSNLDNKCLQCLCEGISECDLTRKCKDEYCGPFWVSKIYWQDAGSLTQLGDTPKRKGAFEDCATIYYCATTIIKNYMRKYARDCNNDDVVDCMDYAMLHMNGVSACSEPLNSTTWGSNFLKSFLPCWEK